MDKAKKIYDKLIWESENRFERGLLDYTVVNMSYNSNKIEGSTMTLDQTWMLYDYDIVSESDVTTKGNDVVEMKNHFEAVKKVVRTANDMLTEDYIKTLHFQLKNNTDDVKLGYNVGEYKKYQNAVGGTATLALQYVEERMKELLSVYTQKQKATLEDIADFHSNYEKIHPFQDGNGMTGRLIVLKECLKNDVVPFIVTNETRGGYITQLKEHQRNNKVSLYNYFKKQQAEYLREAEYFIPELAGMPSLDETVNKE